MKAHHPEDGQRTLAVFIDFENVGLGFTGRRDHFRIDKVLERLVEKGKIVTKKAYADWGRFSSYTSSLHEAAIELIEIPRRGQSGKNSADIRLVVDAIDLAYSKDHIDTFVIVSGDSDFSPLVSKLKELGKHVIGLGLVAATSDLLRDNCDEFIYYEDLDRAPLPQFTDLNHIPENKRKLFNLLLESLQALRRENKEIIFSSMVKDTMKRKKPSFNEEYYGYRTFQELLEDAQKFKIIDIEKSKASGTYVVIRFGTEVLAPQAALPAATPPLALPAHSNDQPAKVESRPERTERIEPTATPTKPLRNNSKEPTPTKARAPLPRNPRDTRDLPPGRVPVDSEEDSGPVANDFRLYGRSLMEEIDDSPLDKTSMARESKKPQKKSTKERKSTQPENQPNSPEPENHDSFGADLD